MISQNDLNNWEANDYLDTVILHSIAILSSLTLDEVKELDLIMKKYSAEILSEVSYLRTYIDFVMDNITTLQQDLYLPEIIDNNADVRNVTFNALSIANLQMLISKVGTDLTETKGKIEASYDLPADSLSIYTDANIEEGINFTEEKATSPIILKYYEGKVFLRKTVSLFEDFSATKKYYDEADLSGQHSFVDKLSSILDTNGALMQSKMLVNTTTEEIIDACLVTFCVYLEYDFDSPQSVELFLSRIYSKIKEDIITALKNHLGSPINPVSRFNTKGELNVSLYTYNHL